LVDAAVDLAVEMFQEVAEQHRLLRAEGPVPVDVDLKAGGHARQY